MTTRRAHKYISRAKRHSHNFSFPPFKGLRSVETRARSERCAMGVQSTIKYIISLVCCLSRRVYFSLTYREKHTPALRHPPASADARLSKSEAHPAWNTTANNSKYTHAAARASFRLCPYLQIHANLRLSKSDGAMKFLLSPSITSTFLWREYNFADIVLAASRENSPTDGDTNKL